MDSKLMDIVFICDDNYAMPTAVAIESLHKNRSASSEYCIHVVCCNVSPENAQKFRSLSENGFDVVTIPAATPREAKKLEKKNIHVSTAALLKFELADMFPDLDKVLYLDGDILVRADLAPLCDTVLDDSCYAAVVKDMKPNLTQPTHMEKINAPHNCSYFNSGVMLLNLKKLRSDNMREKLMDYRINGTNIFMDQDAFNVCFDGKVTFLPFAYNCMTSAIGVFSADDIEKFYGSSIGSRGSDAVILHMCSKYKPWNYSNIPFADEWYHYYESSPFDAPLTRSELDGGNEIFVQRDLIKSKAPVKRSDDRELIISLTSYPARIGFVHLTVRSLLKQTMKADKILLWLAEEQFPNRGNDLPPELTSLVAEGFDIRWCDDLRPHKKYFYTMQEYPESIIITVDDDMEYQDTLVETLYRSYLIFPYAVSCMRAHEIVFSDDGGVAPYAQWKRISSCYYQPSMSLMATGVGGVLYPPHCMPHEVFDADMIKKLCLNADDLWLKTMEVMALTPTVIAGSTPENANIIGSQDTALWKSNDRGNANDSQFRAILDAYNCTFGEKDTLLQRMKQPPLDSMISFSLEARSAVRIASLEAQISYLNGEISNIQKSFTFRIGSLITFLPKKIRGILRRISKK